ncbi:MAG: sugar phosphate isomerase/epimerase family protein [Limisphaerales bacterium]
MPKRTLKKALMMQTFPGKDELSWMDKFKMLKEAGFDGAEPPSHQDHKEILAAREATGIAIASVTVGHHTRTMSDPDPKKREAATEALKQALRDAKAYGATSVLCVAGRVDEQVHYADAYKRAHDAVKGAVPLAEELGVRIAIENVWNNFLLDPMEMIHFVDEFKSPGVGCHFDIGNCMNNGWPEQWIPVLAKRIQKIHVKEYSQKKENSQGVRKGFNVEYLEGDNDWPAIMKALDEIGYGPWAIAEPAYRPANVEPQERLNQISRALDKILAS